MPRQLEYDLMDALKIPFREARSLVMLGRENLGMKKHGPWTPELKEYCLHTAQALEYYLMKRLDLDYFDANTLVVFAKENMEVDDDAPWTAVELQDYCLWTFEETFGHLPAEDGDESVVEEVAVVVAVPMEEVVVEQRNLHKVFSPVVEAESDISDESFTSIESESFENEYVEVEERYQGLDETTSTVDETDSDSSMQGRFQEAGIQEQERVDMENHIVTEYEKLLGPMPGRRTENPFLNMPIARYVPKATTQIVAIKESTVEKSPENVVVAEKKTSKKSKSSSKAEKASKKDSKKKSSKKSSKSVASEMKSTSLPKQTSYKNVAPKEIAIQTEDFRPRRMSNFFSRFSLRSSRRSLQ